MDEGEQCRLKLSNPGLIDRSNLAFMSLFEERDCLLLNPRQLDRNP